MVTFLKTYLLQIFFYQSVSAINAINGKADFAWTASELVGEGGRVALGCGQLEARTLVSPVRSPIQMGS